MPLGKYGTENNPMLSIDLNIGNISQPTILFIGAHCDDIEIGCGGTILRLMKEIPSSNVYWVVFSGNPVRFEEAQQSARQFLQCAGCTLLGNPALL